MSDRRCKVMYVWEECFCPTHAGCKTKRGATEWLAMRRVCTTEEHKLAYQHNFLRAPATASIND